MSVKKGEGFLHTAELLDADSGHQYVVGNKISTYFLSRTGGELRYHQRIGGGGSGAEAIRENAYQSGIS